MYKFGKQKEIFKTEKDKAYFIIFYDEKENAKKLGYKWDGNKKSWYNDLIYSKDLKLYYEVNKNHNEKDIYEKYNDLYFRSIEENVFKKDEKARDIFIFLLIQ